MDRAFIPMIIVSDKTTSPLTNGIFLDLPLDQGSKGKTCFAIVPSGRLTARAQHFKPRIITPSMTACPPYIVPLESKKYL
jgi:hypothetical protein